MFSEGVLTFTLILGLFNLFLVIPFFFFINYSAITSISLFVLFIKSILGAISFLCVMKALKDLEISLALPLLVLTPGLVAVFAYFTLNEALNLYQILGLILLLFGTYSLQLKGNQKLIDPILAFFKSKSYYYVLIALVLFTITSILDKALLKNFGLEVNAFMGFSHLFLALIFLSVVLYKNPKQVIPKYSKSLILIFLVAVFSISYRYTQLSALKVAPVALVLSLKRTSVFFAVLVGGTLFRDKNLFIRIIATLLMIIGAVLVIMF